MNLIDKISKEKTLENRTWLGNFVYKSLILCRRKKGIAEFTQDIFSKSMYK